MISLSLRKPEDLFGVTGTCYSRVSVQDAGFIGRSVVEQMHFIESRRVLKVLNAVYNTPEVKMLINQVHRWQYEY